MQHNIYIVNRSSLFANPKSEGHQMDEFGDALESSFCLSVLIHH